MRLKMMFAACALGAIAPAQFRIPDHNCGIMVTGDFDADGRADVLMLPPNHVPRLYFGMARHPFVRRGPPVSLAKALHPETPVFAGGHLYVPRLRANVGKGYVDVYRLPPNGKAVLVRTHQLDESPGGSTVTSVRLAELDCDIDSDGAQDVVVAWGESPAGTIAAHAAYVSPTRMTPAVAIRRAPGQPRVAFVADLHASFNAFAKRSQFAVVFSGDDGASHGGLGLHWLDTAQNRSRPTAAGGIWFVAPPLRWAGRIPTRAPSGFGAFTSAPSLGAPVIQTALGPSVLFTPWVTPPYVHRRQGQVLATSRDGWILGDATADYDGDGQMEMVFVERLHRTAADFVVVANPDRKRAYIQAFDIGDLVRQPGIRPQHGIKGDFDGDGDPDLLLGCEATGVLGCTLVMLRNARTPRSSGKPSLYMVR